MNTAVTNDFSSQNIKVVQEVYAAFGRRDIPAILTMLRADVEWSEPVNPYNPAGGTRHVHKRIS